MPGRKCLFHEALGFAADHAIALTYFGFETRAVADRDVTAMVVNKARALQTGGFMGNGLAGDLEHVADSSCVMMSSLVGRRS